MVVDPNNYGCNNPVHNGLIVVSEFDVIASQTAYFEKSGGWSGKFTVKRQRSDYGCFRIEKQEVNPASKEFDLVVDYPLCDLDNYVWCPIFMY